MPYIYSSIALKTKQREVKDAALKDVVHITENGNSAFVLLSEELYEQKIREAVEQALYEERMARVISAGRADIEASRSVEGIAAALEAIADLRKATA